MITVGRGRVRRWFDVINAHLCVILSRAGRRLADQGMLAVALLFGIEVWKVVGMLPLWQQNVQFACSKRLSEH